MQNQQIAATSVTRDSRETGDRWYGAYPALVTDVKDPDAQGRVKITLPWAPDLRQGRYEVWARLATMMAGNDRGTWFIPDVNDEVLVVFQGGDPRLPFVIGAMWNGKDAPPEAMDGAGENNRKVIRSRGVKITLDDTKGSGRFIVETIGGQRLTLRDDGQAVIVEDAGGDSIRLQAGSIQIKAAGRVSIECSAAHISAGELTVDAGLAKFSGLVKADTIVANSVVSQTYTNGAGNIW
jgi:uncharacterized protein involved in type VI secretion and phage assembly